MSRNCRYFKIFFQIVLILVFNYYLNSRTKKDGVVKKLTRFLPDMKYFLLWNKVPGIEKEGQTHFVEGACDTVNCYFTSNKSFLADIRYFDAILFNLQDISEQYVDLPKVRGLNQKYIFAANDSSENYPVCNKKYDRFFNWTWSYRQDSIIHYRFFTFKNLNYDLDFDYAHRWQHDMKPISEVQKGYFSSKYIAAAILLDKCHTRSRREIYLEELKGSLSKYNLTVDVYGKCGTKKLGRTMNSFNYKLKKNYFFYLALEDSISVDYVTGSVLYAYQNFAVPVVLDGAVYEHYLPHHSFLDGRKLGPKILAKEMYDIIQNKERYYDYFRWLNYYFVRPSKVLDPCSLCLIMSDQNWLQRRLTINNFREWWNPKYEERCAYYSRYFTL